MLWLISDIETSINRLFAALAAVGARVRDLFAEQAVAADRVHSLVDDTYLADLARAVAGRLGGHVGVAPRLFLRKLVADVLDRVDQFPDFNPRQHYAPPWTRAR